jgi:hypothetical protein
LLDDARRGARYVAGLRRYLREPMTTDEARARVRRGSNARREQLLHVLEHAVYARPASPYRRLLEWAGVELGDARALVLEHGVDEALGRLYDAGVRLSLDELKGRVPIERPGLAIPPREGAFDNPLVRSTFSSQSSGSRGPAIRIRMNFGSLTTGTAYTALLISSFDLGSRATALWRPVPPGRAGLHWALQASKLGLRIERWFAQTRLGPSVELAYLRTALLGTRLWGAVPAPAPEYVPLDRAEVVARWLDGRRAHLNSPASSAVRVCLAAEEHGLDVSGTLFRAGGEPLTEAKAAVVERAGARMICTYSISEIGRVGVACAAAEHRDEQHLCTDTLGVVQRDRGSLWFTTLDPSARVLLLNAEVGDQGVLTRRRCGCALDEVGLDLHVHDIRSYEKLTSEGMNFYGADLLRLVEETLPSRFGGAPTDYQVVEEEVDGVPRVTVLVSPRVGEVDEAALVAAALEALRAGPAHHGLMTQVWRDAGTLRVSRREPQATAAAKVLPLHVPGPPRASARGGG